MAEQEAGEEPEGRFPPQSRRPEGPVGPVARVGSGLWSPPGGQSQAGRSRRGNEIKESEEGAPESESSKNKPFPLITFCFLLRLLSTCYGFFSYYYFQF